MNCKEVGLLIEEFYDGEVALHLKPRVEAHIAVCSLCSAEFEKMHRLDQLLEKTPAPPPPSALLDQRLMEAFQHQNKETAISPSLWQRIFAGSLIIPKPAFAAALVVIAFAITAANLVGRYAATSSESSAISAVPMSTVFVPSPPEIIQETKIIEVPVVKERVVTRIVYVERQNSEAIKPQEILSAQNGIDRNKQEQTLKKDDSNLAMNGAVEDSGYVTRANLIGFQPPAELKTRIIQEGKTNEK